MGQAPVRRVFLLNGAIPRTRAFAHVADTLAGEKLRVCPVIVHNRTAYPETVPYGETVLTMFPGSAAAHEMAALYAYLMALVTAPKGLEPRAATPAEIDAAIAGEDDEHPTTVH
jgi:hypothetical protein